MKRKQHYLLRFFSISLGCFLLVSSADVSEAKRRRPAKRSAKRSAKHSTKRASATKDTPPVTSKATNETASDDEGIRRGDRVEFDGRLVQGQTASGALLLLARKRAELQSMVKERTAYRREILRTVYPDYGTEGSWNKEKRE